METKWKSSSNTVTKAWKISSHNRKNLGYITTISKALFNIIPYWLCWCRHKRILSVTYSSVLAFNYISRLSHWPSSLFPGWSHQIHVFLHHLCTDDIPNVYLQPWLWLWTPDLKSTSYTMAIPEYLVSISNSTYRAKLFILNFKPAPSNFQSLFTWHQLP